MSAGAESLGAQLEAACWPSLSLSSDHRRQLAATRARMQRFLARHPNARSARCRAGHFTSSAFIVHSDGAFLFLFHQKLRRWLQPGGHMEPERGELCPIETARREAEEETGIKELELVIERPIDLDIHWIPARGEQRRHAHLDLRYLFRSPPGAVVRPNHESEGVRWLTGRALAEVAQEPSIGRALIVAQQLSLETPRATRR